LARHAKNTDITIAGSTSLAGSLVSQWFRLENMERFSLTVHWAGAPVGTFILQSSDDDGGGDQGNPVIVNAIDVTGSAVAVPNASGEGVNWNHSAAGMRWIRVSFAPSGGSGGNTTSMRITGKGAG